MAGRTTPSEALKDAAEEMAGKAQEIYDAAASIIGFLEDYEIEEAEACCDEIIRFCEELGVET